MEHLFLIIVLASFLVAIVFLILWAIGKAKKVPNTHGKKAGIALLVCVVAYIGFGITHTPSEKTKDSKSAQQESAQKKTTQEPSIEDILAKAAENGSRDTPIIKYRDIVVTQQSDGSNIVVANFTGEMGWDKQSTLKEYRRTAAHVMKEVFSSGVNVNGCDFVVWMNVIDKKTGKEDTWNIYGLTLKKDAADKINWENVDQIDITQSAETEKILPILR